MSTSRPIPVSESSSVMLTRITWGLVVCGIGAVGIVVFLIISDSFRGNEEVVAEQAASRKNSAAFLPAASLVEAVTPAAPTIKEPVVSPPPPPEFSEPEATPTTPEAVDKPSTPLGRGKGTAATRPPANAVAAKEVKDSPAEDPPPAVESVVETQHKPRKLRPPPQLKYRKAAGFVQKDYTLTYDTPAGIFQVYLHPTTYPRQFRLTSPPGTKFTEEDFQGRRWGGLVVIEDDVYFATDGDIYRYQSEPEETFVFVESWFSNWRIGGSLDQYFLLYAPTGGWNPHAEFLGLLDLHVGENGLPQWHLLPYEGSYLQWVKEMKVDTKRQLLTISFCKPEDPSVVRGKGAKQKYVTLTFDVATETFLPDTESTLAASE